ncbi:alpha-amylase family protein [Haloferula sp.]|uniref:alpha-amylase family protein n=1 Tax=Haloferula sp. TaxID=2497595 RepID=UPI00329DAA34
MNHPRRSLFGITRSFCIPVVLFFTAIGASADLEQEARSKIEILEGLMADAGEKSLDVTREETRIWFANEFLKFADWDEENIEANEYLFGVYHEPFRSQKKKYAQELPDFERQKVIEILDEGISTLEAVIAGDIVRRPVNKVDWQNIEVADDVLLSNGKPIFLYDYFSKSVGRPLTDTRVYNDHLGAIFHGGENLYPVDHDRAINSFLLKEDGTWDDGLLKEITGISDTNVGFLLFWNGGIPDWVLKKEPEANRGRGLFTGFDIDNPLVREVWGKIARKSGELTQGKKVTQLGYILSNEPHWYAEKGYWTQRFKEMNSLSSYTDAKFKAWLKDAYGGDIAKLNENWGKSFKDFESVTYPFPLPPALRGKPLWYDFCRFNMDRGTEWFTYIQSELKRGNPEADTSIKLQPNLFSENARSHGIDMEALTELTSMIGDDAKTKWVRSLNAKGPEPWEERYSYLWEELSSTYDFLSSVAPDKIHFNSENHFLSASWVRELDQPVDYVRNVYWLATIQGMDANIAWWWARDPDGSPEDRMEGELDFFDPALAGSYAASANQQPQIVNEVTQVMYDLNSFSEEVMEIRRQRRPLRLFYSETSAINKKQHMTEHHKLYEQLFFEGFPLGYATENILRKQDASAWDAIVVYKTQFVTDSEFEALQSYLDQGGTVILDGKSSLSKDEYGKPRKESLKESKGKLLKANGTSTDAVAEAALEAIDGGELPIALSEENGTNFKGCTWRVVDKPGGGHLANILNLGRNTARLTLALKDGKAVSATDMLTGQDLGSEFELKPNGVLLLEVK